MPRDLSGIASPPPGVFASPLTVIQSQAQQNAFVDDVYQILNTAWPEQYGGTGQTDGSPTLAEIQALIDSVAAVPIGSLHVNTGDTLPDGYIWANGGSYSRSTYSALWGWVQGSGNLASSQGSKTVGQYGPGNGSSTFTVPNLTEYFVRSSTVGNTGRVQSDQLGQHNHTASTASSGSHNHNGSTGNGGSHNHTGTTSQDGLHGHSIGHRGSGTGEGRVTTISSGGTDGGNYVQSLNLIALEGGAHSHNLTTNTVGNHNHSISTDGSHTHGVTVNNTGGNETRPQNISYPFMIKV